jgi:hypothetical protein
LKPIFILRAILIACAILVIIIYFKYHGTSWPAGTEAMGCLISLIILASTLIMLWIFENKLHSYLHLRNIKLGLYIGLLWTIEIGINNILHPGLPLRDIIDNIFWGIIAFLIFIISFRDTYYDKTFSAGIKAGWWSGLASGAIACFTAMSLIVFGMSLIISDPLNIIEWSDVKNSVTDSGMSVYFAYQTLAGAIMHLVILGAIMGLILGTLGAALGKLFLNLFNHKNSLNIE